MIIGLTYDLKEAVRRDIGAACADDCLEEYDSRETVDALAGVIASQGHEIVHLGGGKDFIKKVLREHVDLVFNIAEGRGSYRSREAQVPSILEMLSIPYSGSDPQCLAICLDKPLTKKIVSTAGVHTPQWRIVSDKKELAKIDWSGFSFPAFVKPAYEGSSKGILTGCRIDDRKYLKEPVANLLDRYQQPVLVEEFIGGDEVTVGIVGNHIPKVAGIMRVVPKKQADHFVYSLEMKRNWEQLIDYECPAKLDPKIMKSITDASLKVFNVMGCRDVSRIDFRINDKGIPFFLEINPLPGLNPHSGDLPIMAGKMGCAYQKLILSILNAAISRYPQCVQR